MRILREGEQVLCSDSKASGSFLSLANPHSCSPPHSSPLSLALPHSPSLPLTCCHRLATLPLQKKPPQSSKQPPLPQQQQQRRQQAPPTCATAPAPRTLPPRGDARAASRCCPPCARGTHTLHRRDHTHTHTHTHTRTHKHAGTHTDTQTVSSSLLHPPLSSLLHPSLSPLPRWLPSTTTTSPPTHFSLLPLLPLLPLSPF
jgi:hypothetical protein